MNYKNNGKQDIDMKKFTIKTMLLIVASLGMLTASAAFTQGHPVSQIFTANNNPFSQCQQGQVLTSQGNCITPSTGGGGSGNFPGDVFVNESGDTMSGNLDMGGNNIIGLNSIGGTSGECGINEPCPSTVRAEDIKANNELCLDRPYSTDNDHTITSNECISDVKLTDLSSGGGQNSGDGYIGNSATPNSPHVAGGPISMSNSGTRYGIWGAKYITVHNRLGASKVEARSNLCIGGDGCISSWSAVNHTSTGGDGYLPEDSPSSDVDMAGHGINGVDSISLEGDGGSNTITYDGAIEVGAPIQGYNDLTLQTQTCSWGGCETNKMMVMEGGYTGSIDVKGNAIEGVHSLELEAQENKGSCTDSNEGEIILELGTSDGSEDTALYYCDGWAGGGQGWVSLNT